MANRTADGFAGIISAMRRARGALAGPAGVRLLAGAGALGVLLLCLPVFRGGAQTAPPAQAASQSCADEEYPDRLGARLKQILGRMQGVGEVEVLVTVSQDSQYIYATDTTENDQSDQAAAGGTGGSTQRQTQQSHVILNQDSGDQGLLTTRLPPRVQGVVVVCQGGGDPEVAARITEAVTAALGVGPSRISVSKLG